MKFGKTFLPLIFLLLPFWLSAQKSEIYTNSLVAYNHALQLYQNKDYQAALIKFDEIKDQFDEWSELRARSYYYKAFCLIRIDPKQGDELMQAFVKRFPTSTKQNTAFLEVADYYFNNSNYPYALKWYSRVNTEALSRHELEDYNFRFGYGLFAAGHFSKAKAYFAKLLDSKKYGAQAKYYYGYIAYRDDDFAEADKYFNEIAENKALGKDIPYFLANIRFKTGKFQEAIDRAVPLLEKSGPKQKSELNKIIGESYFNLDQYEKAIPYLMEYKGKKGRWNNTDYYMLGYAFYKKGDYQKAEEWFSKIIDGDNAVSQNAYYLLADCYLKRNKKQEALNAFRNAAQMDYDPAIKQQAWLNYAKLSYEIGNPYESTAEVIRKYLKTYPGSPEANELKELLISSYVIARDFEGALNYLKDQKDTENYQILAFLRGIQLFENQEYEKAITYFDQAMSKENVFRARALFWKAESLYRLQKYNGAITLYKSFLESEFAPQTPEFKNVNYNLAYAFFKVKDYNQAGGFFRLYTEQPDKDHELYLDALMRLGDSYFALGNYLKALTPYRKVVEENDLYVDYAQFQIALCYGYMGDRDKKISALNEFLRFHLKSPLRDDAYYQLGNSYFNQNQTKKALSAYQTILEQYPESAYVPKALLKIGLIYYNSDQNEKALAEYKKVIKNYPNTDAAKEAVNNARQIYIDLGKVNEFERLVKGLSFVKVSDDEIEEALYESGEKQYLANDLKKAEENFLKYLKRYPDGVHALEVNYYLADLYNRNKQVEKAIPYYEKVITSGRNDFTENALVSLSQIYLEKENRKKAKPLLQKLEEVAQREKNRLFAQSNLMKTFYEEKSYQKAAAYADKILKKDKIEENIRSDAQIIIARSAFQTGDFEKAREAFKKVEKTATGKLKAEALYYDALFKHRDGDYKNSNLVVQKLASDYANYRYWGAKALVIMAKNFYALDDAYQATYVLKSLIENFPEFEDVTEEAKIELQRIKKEQAKTNESVIQNK